MPATRLRRRAGVAGGPRETLHRVFALSQVPVHIDMIDVFRRSEAIPELVDEMIAVKPGTVWFQLGIFSPESEIKLKDAGINVVSNRCVMQVLG